ncbi:MAG TPA: NAD-binding protein [Gemmataceae bacterium]|nr:NAD-binding protein [Gemmataceae bacterium]
MERPIVLCGLGRMGARVLEYLQAANLPVVVIDTQCRADDPRLRGARLVGGDCRRREVLEAAGVAAARGVLVLTSDDLVNVSTTLTVRAIHPGVRVVLRMFNQNLLGRLGQAVRNVFALSTSMLTAPVLAVTALTGQGLGGFHLEGQEDGWRQVAEVTVAAGSGLRGRTVGEAAAARGAAVLAHLPEGGPDRFLIDVDLEQRLRAGDRLVLCGEPRSLGPLLAGLGEGESTEPLWAGWLRRWGRVVWRTLAETDRAVQICTLVLVAVLVGSTLVLHLGVEKYTVPDALFRTVSVMATGASMHEEDVQDSPRMKLFLSALRILGAALTAAFTAIVTNYLLRARLGGAFEMRRIPDGGHVLVCGLGTVGFRVIEELVRLGEPVVVIERNADNRFVVTARRLGAAVIVGDAGVAEVLRQAHAGTARAVIAATNNDLVNLAVALLVRELNAAQRVVLLLSDPQLAGMLREAANVKLAVSVEGLAAPAFVAALFGGRVLSAFLLRERLYAVLDLVVQEKDPFAGQSVRALAVDYRLMPVAVLPAAGPPSRLPMGARLVAGDRLVAVSALSDLERVLGRQPAPGGCAVEVTAFPLPARGWLAGLVRTAQGLGPVEAEKALDELPLRLGRDLTRGQAEDLLAQLLRERVSARLCPAPKGPA